MTKRQVTQLSYEITGLAIQVHKELGAGLLESVYEKCLVYELENKGYDIQQQLDIELNYKGLNLDTSLRVDILVNDCIIVELKTVQQLLPVHQAQLLTYMRLLKKPQGLLINFYTDNISKSMIPLINEYFKQLKD